MAGPFRRILAVAGLLALLAAGCTEDGNGGGPAPSTTASTAARATVVTTTTVTVTSTPAPLAAPWSAPKLRADQVPPVLLREWRAGGARADCAALAPADLGRAAAGAPRRADFGERAWAVAWDVPGAPGRLASGVPCADCGRGTVVLAGTGLDLPPERTRPPAAPLLTNERRWSDGSVARYGLEGGTGPAFLAQLEVTGQRCLYNVTTFLGQAHLELLLESLRFVEGAP